MRWFHFRKMQTATRHPFLPLSPLKLQLFPSIRGKEGCPSLPHLEVGAEGSSPHHQGRDRGFERPARASSRGFPFVPPFFPWVAFGDVVLFIGLSFSQGTPECASPPPLHALCRRGSLGTPPLFLIPWYRPSIPPTQKAPVPLFSSRAGPETGLFPPLRAQHARIQATSPPSGRGQLGEGRAFC